MLARLRDSNDARTAIDLTTDLRIPVVAAYSTDQENRNFVCGSAARTLDALPARRSWKCASWGRPPAPC